MDVTDEADRRARDQLDPRRAALVPAHMPDHLHDVLHPLPSVPDRHTINWARRIGDCASTIARQLRADTAPPVVQIREPCSGDVYQESLDQATWDVTPERVIWGSPFIFLVDDFCGGFPRRDVTGCIVPIRPQPEQPKQDEPLHRAELFCALALLHRQLKRNRPDDDRPRPYRYFVAMHVTVVAVTQDRIRIHEASVGDSTKTGGASVIRIVKRLDLSIRDVTGEANTMCDNGHAVGDNWLDVMSYMCFADEDHVSPDLVSRPTDAPTTEPMRNTLAETAPPYATTLAPVCASSAEAASLDAATITPVSYPPVKAASPDAVASEPEPNASTQIAPIPQTPKPRTPLAPIPHGNAINTQRVGKAGSPKKNKSPVKGAPAPPAPSREDTA
ncbi:hypothetical protein DPSP01_012772 [Paraphaeosphaeria sporulosa]|uniref:Uncharacterized protein n=1 Tax=Paraphaeosphaeria sporulosa TaxID=1460663 RepID=A0A177BW00_9PLEO|nr:uncharacterized protein CC84DRAFT_1264908 [Paraphaeosphaeria sporulosa]OAF98509.1 hypothetical protein CC84DRAFT_1264908 [Paraphaeosphaeria sporulosa]